MYKAIIVNRFDFTGFDVHIIDVNLEPENVGTPDLDAFPWTDFPFVTEKINEQDNTVSVYFFERDFGSLETLRFAEYVFKLDSVMLITLHDVDVDVQEDGEYTINSIGEPIRTIYSYDDMLYH